MTRSQLLLFAAALLSASAALAGTPPGKLGPPGKVVMPPRLNATGDLPPAYVHGWVRQFRPGSGQPVNGGSYPVYTVVMISRTVLDHGRPAEFKVGGFGGGGTPYDVARNAWGYRITLAPDLLAVGAPDRDPERAWTVRFNPTQYRFGRVEVLCSVQTGVGSETGWAGAPRAKPFPDLPN